MVQFYAKDETSWEDYLETLHDYVQPRAQGTAFTEMYLQQFKHHLEAISKPGVYLKTPKCLNCPGAASNAGFAWSSTGAAPAMDWFVARRRRCT
ncbi:Uncharacterized protein ABJ99_2777 [Pseudomonas syringae pv. cilantro]|uniref:Uncharacterized protein n=1 Tax=Pseudomonas syringae pv. cilantro TaxID=81035 RepID=A0A0N1JMP9_PSESX|nr:Uncharacterized protein ABJ99_2777 [Pseudomonas syringae pv. cilantro]